MENNKILLDEQLYTLENGSCSIPHRLLGLHSLEGAAGQVLRVFCPQASQIVAVDLQDESKQYPLAYKGFSGLFEAVIEDRQEKFLYKLNCQDHEGHNWSYIDPYQFESTLTSEDLYLFGIGKDYEIHHKLGAHFIEVANVKGVRFAVWAPHAKRVSVIGNFNNWDGRRNSMRRLSEQGVWEIFIPGLQEGDIYKFEILTEKEELLYKTDPYASFYEMRPNNASIVYDTNKYKWKDKRWMNKREKKVPYKEPMSIYEVHIGSWKKHEDDTFYTYREVAHELGTYVKEMGYTHVELMGIVEHPFDGSWGYQVTGYFAPTSRYGTPDDFKYFVEVMHQHDISVILDWVPAHFPKDAFALEKFDGKALYEKDNEKEAHHPHWGTLIFDYAKPQVALFLISSALSWLETYHIDGLRVDAVASMLYLDYGRQDDFVPNKYGGNENIEAIAFLKHLNEVAYSRVPGIMMIAEESTAWPKVTYPVSEDGLGFGFKWNMGWMNDFLYYMKTPPEYRSGEHGKVTFSLMYTFSENFIQVLSHDEVVHGKSSMINKMPGNEKEKFANLKVAYGYLYGHPGKKMQFMGNEFAQDNEWNEKVALNWELLNYPIHQGISEFVKALNQVYSKEKALWETGNGYENFEWIDCENREQSIISFIRRAPETNDVVVVVINFKNISYQNYRIGVPEVGTYHEILNSDDKLFTGEGMVNGKVKAQDISWHNRPASMELTIPPLSVMFFKLKRTTVAKKKSSAKESTKASEKVSTKESVKVPAKATSKAKKAQPVEGVPVEVEAAQKVAKSASTGKAANKKKTSKKVEQKTVQEKDETNQSKEVKEKSVKGKSNPTSPKKRG